MGGQLETTSEHADVMDAQGGRSDPLRGQLEEALARVASLEAKLSSQACQRAELVHLVSHELRNPITVISGFGRLLQNQAHGSLNKEQTHYIDESLKACRRLDQFVVDLLEAQPESATPFSIEIAAADLDAVIRAHLESLAPLLSERGIEVEVQLAANSPRLYFDERRIEQVITNLMSNAIRYGRPGGTIRVSTNSRASAPSAVASVEVVIEDDGPGIPADDREHLFAPYVRGEGHADCEGLGIGLAICRRVIAAHGGEIRVENSELGGARFVFELPGRDPATGED
jgi:signal transduction histidine kinase